MRAPLRAHTLPFFIDEVFRFCHVFWCFENLLFISFLRELIPLCAHI
ncbi:MULTISPECIES: hypothetical protein [unclassified Helicobacter]|nr:MULTISPECIES: hypothetical protein [unclassified Helicobacter]